VSGGTDAFGDPLPDGAVARLGTIRLRQPMIHSLAFSSDGKTLASAGATPIHLWDVESGRLFQAIDPAAGARWSIAFADDVLGGVASGSMMATWVGRKRMLRWKSISFASATLGWDGRWVACDNGRLFVERDPRSHEWDTHVLDGIEDADAAAAFGGRRLAIVIESTGDVRIFGVPGGALQARIPCGGVATALAVSASGGTMAAGFDDGRVGLWDVATRRQVAEWPAHPGPVDALAFAPDMQTLASGSGTRIRLWNPASGGERLSLPTFDDPPARLSFHPDAPRIVTRSGLVLQEWDPETGAELSSIAARGAWDDGSRLPESRFALTGDDAEWTLWDTALGRATLRIPRSGIAAVSTDGAQFAEGAVIGGGDTTITLRNLPGGTVRWKHPLPVRREEPTYLRFLPEGGQLLAGHTYDRIWLLDATTGDTRRVFDGPVAFSRIGEHIASTAPGADEAPRRRVEIATRNKRGWVAGITIGPQKTAIRAIAFAPFRQRIAIATEGDVIEVYDLDKPTHAHARFAAPAHELVFSADARRLASISWASAEVLVWDVPA